MAYILFHRTTGRRVKSYPTLSGARRGMTVSNKNAGWEMVCKVWYGAVESQHGRCHNARPASYGAAPYSLAHEADYQKLYGNQTRTVHNLMTGALVEEDINTPFACSVSSESYWSS